MAGDATAAAGDGLKRTRCERPDAAVDLLSALPDALLLHILSFLRMEDVVSTALLSRRWRHLWTSTSCLDFSCGGTSRRLWFDYAPPNFIDRVLSLHNGAKVRTFRAAVRVPDEGREYEWHELIQMVDSWVCFAVRRRVEDLELGCVEIEPDYTLPDCAFACEALVSLALQFCRLDLPSRILMSSLRNLTLYCVEIVHGKLKDLLAGCPSLESLTLQNFYPCFYHGVCAERLKTLKIIDDFDPSRQSDYRVHISAPSLTTLVLNGYLKPYHAMKDLSSVVTASLDFGFMLFWKVGFNDFECLADLIRGLSHVQVLRLCPWCIQRSASETNLGVCTFLLYHVNETRPSRTLE